MSKLWKQCREKITSKKTFLKVPLNEFYENNCQLISWIKPKCAKKGKKTENNMTCLLLMECNFNHLHCFNLHSTFISTQLFAMFFFVFFSKQRQKIGGSMQCSCIVFTSDNLVYIRQCWFELSKLALAMAAGVPAVFVVVVV